jgi:peptide/nickel transport system permease protein
MTRYVAGRLTSSLFVLFTILTVTFFLIKLAPGGLTLFMDPEMDPEDRARIEHNLGLDQPIHIQYFRWLSNASHGDLGRSIMYGRPVSQMVLERVPATLQLAGTALLLAVLVGVPLGVYCALRQYSLSEQILSFLSFVGLALPNFWLGIVLIILFSVTLGWLPSAGMQTAGVPASIIDRFRHLVLPASVLATTSLAELMRYTRSSWLDVMRADYVPVARAKGLSEFVVQHRHVLRNALIPVVTILGLRLPVLVGGAAIVETLFGWPGMGRLAVDAALKRDTPVVLGCVLLVSVAVTLSNLLVDLLYPYIDPRVSHR